MAVYLLCNTVGASASACNVSGTTMASGYSQYDAISGPRNRTVRAVAGSAHNLEYSCASQAVTHVVDYLGPPESDMWKSIILHEQELQATLIDYLVSQPHVTIYGAAESASCLRVPTVSFVVKGWNSQELVEKVEKDSNYAFRWGGFYSNRLVHELLGLGSDGVVRISMVHYNTGKFARTGFCFHDEDSFL